MKKLSLKIARQIEVNITPSDAELAMLSVDGWALSSEIPTIRPRTDAPKVLLCRLGERWFWLPMFSETLGKLRKRFSPLKQIFID